MKPKFNNYNKLLNNNNNSSKLCISSLYNNKTVLITNNIKIKTLMFRYKLKMLNKTMPDNKIINFIHYLYLHLTYYIYN